MGSVTSAFECVCVSTATVGTMDSLRIVCTPHNLTLIDGLSVLSSKKPVPVRRGRIVTMRFAAIFNVFVVCIAAGGPYI